MPRLPRNLHLVATWHSPDNAIRKKHATRHIACHAKWLWTRPLRLPQKLQLIFWKRRKSIAPATQNDTWHVTKHVWMSRSATPATRNEATPHVKPLIVTPVAELVAIGTAIRGSRGRLRTVANGCGRLRTVANGCGRLGNVERTHAQPPEPQSETGTLATHSGKGKGQGKGKGGEGERTGGKGLSVIWGYCLNKWVSLSSRQVVPLIVPLASMQLCMKQLLLCTFCTLIGNLSVSPLGRGYRYTAATQCLKVWITFQTQASTPEVVGLSFDRTIPYLSSNDFG